MTDSNNHEPIDSAVHHAIMRGFVDRGVAVSSAELAETLGTDIETVTTSLDRLQVNHGVILDPPTAQVWIAHPFSATPTLFYVEGEGVGWWAPCIWCALGIVALVGHEKVVIKTRLGGKGAPCDIECTADGIHPNRLWAHFPIPPRTAWANVHRHCACTLVFADLPAIDRWCEEHRVERGEVLSLEHTARFAAIWYGNHLAEDWRKPTIAQAKSLFEKAGLTSAHWQLDGGTGRF